MLGMEFSNVNRCFGMSGGIEKGEIPIICCGSNVGKSKFNELYMKIYKERLEHKKFMVFAYNAGVESGRDGRLLRDNQYGVTTKEHQFWKEGFMNHEKGEIE